MLRRNHFMLSLYAHLFFAMRVTGGGVKLRDVLEDCGWDVDALALGEKMPPGGVKHVQMEGYDQDETGYTYGGSFPVEKAFDGLGEVILAYEMNGEELPRDHGYPVRMLIPGHVGARQVKWIHKIILSNEESKKSYQCKSYRHFAPDITFEKGMSCTFPVCLRSILCCNVSW